MRKTEKTVGLMMFVLMLSIIVAACSGKQANQPNESPKSETSSNTAISNQTTEVREDLEITVFTEESPVQPLRQDSPVIQELYKRTGVKINFDTATGDNYSQKRDALLATNNIPDVIYIRSSQLSDYGKTGMFLPISDYFDSDMPNFKKLFEDNPVLKSRLVDGKLYGLPQLGKYQIEGATAPMLRVDLLEKLGLEIPESFDDLYNVLKKFKEAYPDTYPMANRNEGDNVLFSLSYAMGSGYDIYYDYDVNGGQWVFGPATQQFKEVLKFANKLYSEKLLDPDYATTTKSGWMEKLSSGKSLFYYDNNTFAVEFNALLQTEDPDARFDLIPPLKGPNGVVRDLKWPLHWLGYVYVVNSNIKDPSRVMQFFDYMYSDEGSDITNFGIPDVHFKKVDGENVILDSVVDQYKDYADPFRAMQSDLGTGLLGFSLYVDEKPQELVSHPDLVRWGKTIGSNELIKQEMDRPSFNEEELDKIKDVETKVDTLLNQNMDKFIMGTRSLDDYDNFIAELEKAGSKELENVFNQAQARLE